MKISYYTKIAAVISKSFIAGLYFFCLYMTKKQITSINKVNLKIMKKVRNQLLIISLSILFTTGAFAQKFHYGVKAGANFAVQSEIADYFNNSDIRTGLNVAAFGNYHFNDHISLQAEVGYDQKGGKSEDVTAKYDYLSVPVLFKYSLGKSDQTAMKFNINLGPYAAFLLNAEMEQNDQTIDMKDATKDFEAGAILGFGMKYPVGNDHIIFDLRMGLGLTNFSDVESQEDSSNKYIGISLGYEF